MFWFAGRSENFRKELSAACPDGIDICTPQLSFRLSASMASDSVFFCLSFDWAPQNFAQTSTTLEG